MVSASSRSHPAHPRADLQPRPRRRRCLGPARPGRRRAQLLTPTSTVAQRLNNAWPGLCEGAVTRSAAQGHMDTAAAGKPPDNASRGHPIRVPRARAGAQPMDVCGEEMRARLLGDRLTPAPPRRLSRRAGRRADAAGATRCHPALPGPRPRSPRSPAGGRWAFPLSSASRRELGTQTSAPPCPWGSVALSMACLASPCPVPSRSLPQTPAPFQGSRPSAAWFWLSLGKAGTAPLQPAPSSKEFPGAKVHSKKVSMFPFLWESHLPCRHLGLPAPPLPFPVLQRPHSPSGSVPPRQGPE